MEYLRSPGHMAYKLLSWGIEPSRVKALVAYQFGHSPSMKHINTLKSDLDRKKEAHRKQHEKSGLEGKVLREDAYRRMMEDCNRFFVRALWREIHEIQNRAKSNG